MFIKLPLSIRGMMAHGHENERYTHYALEIATILSGMEYVRNGVCQITFPL
jgi:hypothetical protein